jgi:hypothetical protein
LSNYAWIGEDLDEFILDGDDAVFQGKPIKVVFSKFYTVITPEGVGVSSYALNALCKSTDISGVVVGNSITIKNIIYKIIEIQPEDTGFTTLILSRD